MIILSLGVAFYFGWALTLIILAALPVFILSGLIMSHVMKGGLMSQMKAYS
jgi:ABC-type bacteriocin/lantibiotic exporter with double-glycine peptidase domain